LTDGGQGQSESQEREGKGQAKGQGSSLTDVRSDPVFKDTFNFVHLRSDSDVISVCHNGLCCWLNYTRRPVLYF